MHTVILSISAAIVLLLLYGVIIYNRFVLLNRRSDEAWSGILVQLKKRHDLVPNMVETVKGYASHEKGLLEELVAKRSMLGATFPGDVAQEENAFSRVLGRFFALAEAYPDLKASSNFSNLQDELSAIENSLQMARRYYNGTVRDYNVLVESFPSLIIANIFKFTVRSFFELENMAEAEVPQVQF